jgi:hypothetical protein
MGIDEARDDDVAGRVDDLRVVRGDVRTNVLDRVPLDEDVRPRQLADGVVLAEHDRVLDQDPVGHGSLLRFRDAADGWGRPGHPDGRFKVEVCREGLLVDSSGWCSFPGRAGKRGDPGARGAPT